MCVVSVPNKACSLDFPHQLASLDPISGWHAMIIHICMDDAAVHHYSATGTLDADVCAAAASGSLPRKDKGNSIHARIIMCRPQIASHPLFPPERKTTASGRLDLDRHAPGIAFLLQQREKQVSSGFRTIPITLFQLRRNQHIVHVNHVLWSEMSSIFRKGEVRGKALIKARR